MSRLTESRLEIEQRLADVRRAMDREVGLAPRTGGWIKAVLGLSVGLLLAGRFVRKRRKKKENGKRARVSSSGA